MKLHRILKSFNGSQDGNHTEHFQVGTEVLLSPSLAAIVIKEGWAEPILPTASVELPEQKSLDEAPANKAKVSAPANKSKK
ncbi:hypothetical protein BH10PLA2_BH10PLA2_00560 [soil metagenome]